MKKVHSMEWFEEKFQDKILDGRFYCFGTCNGADYSFCSDSKEAARFLAKHSLMHNGHIVNEEESGLVSQIHVLNRKIEELKIEHSSECTQMRDHRKAMLMSVYYLLDTITSAGTHGEKRVIITHLKAVIANMVNNGDSFPFQQPEFGYLAF